MQVAHKFIAAVAVGGIGLGAGLGSRALTNHVADKGSDASLLEFGAVHGGVPLVGIGSLVAVPTALKAGVVPAALVGALGIGTLGGLIAATVDN